MSRPNSPYCGLPPEKFWKTGVSEQTPTEIEGVYKKKFSIAPTDRIVTAGSCFAQHITRQLKQRGYNVLDKEPSPPGMDIVNANRFGYGLYSARYGNIYHIRQLLQLAMEAIGNFNPADYIWEKDGRYFDALRPSVEPEGHSSPEAVEKHRKSHLKIVKKLLNHVDIFVFTFGLTEAWVHKPSGTIYPVAPGVIASSYDSNIHLFQNFGFMDIYSDFLKFRDLLKSINPNVRFIVTVSPVPLTATASTHHVLPATTYSKSVLRAVAGQLSDELADVDYFPSYELIASSFSRGLFYSNNLRNVTQAGVDNAMRIFFSEHRLISNHNTSTLTVAMKTEQQKEDDLICEEILLEAFGT